MIFKFLKYVKPTSYFTLKNKPQTYLYPLVKYLPKDVLNQLVLDDGYQSKTAKELDLSYQALEKGYVGSSKRINKVDSIPIEDEYRFLKKYFSAFWCVYVFVIRLLSFKNPIKEVNGFVKSFEVLRFPLFEKPILHQHWKAYQSSLVASKPKVSIVIPTLNRYVYLKDVLLDLEKQTHQNFEVIVVDQSTPFQKEFYDDFNLNIKLIHQQEKALWLARNRAVELSDANYLLLFDDDSRVSPDWITTHLKCLDFFKADISSGVSISLVGAKVPENYAFFKHSEQLDTGNVLIKKTVFKTIGLFDRQYEKQRMGDGEFGLRAYLHGFKNISNPFAQRLHLKVGTGGLRQMGSWDGFRPKKWFAPRPIPSVVYQFRKYYGTKMTLLNLLKSVPPSVVPYRFKSNKKAILLAYVSLLLIWPIILIQVTMSWRQASLKLKQGAMIKALN